jgi:hypothetical protein
MAAPAPPQQAPPAQQQQLAAQVAQALAGAATISAAVAVLAAPFAAAGISALALWGALAAVMSYPAAQLGAIGPATRQMSRLNPVRRAQFVIASARPRLDAPPSLRLPPATVDAPDAA